LNYRGETSLDEEGFAQIPALARSFDNRIWLFDPSRQKLLKISKDGVGLLESNSFVNLVDGKINPTQIIDINKNVYVNNPATGIMEFDLFGNMLRQIPLTNISNLQLIEKNFFFFREGRIYRYEPDLFKETEIIINNAFAFNNAIFHRERLILVGEKSLLICKYFK
jgi:hypothetical protein